MSSRFTLRLFRSNLLSSQTENSLNLFKNHDYGRLIKTHHDLVAEDKLPCSFLKGLCMTSYLAYNNHYQAKLLLNELCQFWDTTKPVLKSDSKSLDAFSNSETAVIWLLDQKHELAANFLRSNLPSKIWQKWDLTLQLRLLRSQIFNDLLEDAISTFCFLASRYNFKDSIILDRLLYRVRQSSLKLFLKLIRTGDELSIPMAPGYVYSLIYQAALFTTKTRVPNANIPKSFSPPPPFPPEDMSTIEDIFDWAVALHHKGYFIKEPAWAIILVRVIQLRGSAAGLDCFEYFKTFLNLNQVFYSIIIHGFVAARNLPQAEKIYLEMSSHFVLDEVSYGTMLNGYVQLKDVSGAQRFLSSMPRDMPLNVITTTMLVNLAVKTAPNMESAEELYREFLNSGEEPDLYLLGTMLHGYYLHRDQEGADQILLEMKRFNLQPDLFALNMLISIGTIHLDAERALSAAQLILQSKLRPNITTYNNLMSLFSAQGQIEKVETLFNGLERKGFDPNLYSFNILIITQARSSQPLKAFETYSVLKKTGLKPSYLTFSVLLTLVHQYQLFHYVSGLNFDMDTYGISRSAFKTTSQFSGLKETLQACSI